MNYFNYFTEIEDAFVRRRGKHLLLSPMDWALIESWKTMDVPLHVVLRGIEKSFDSWESKPRKRSIKTLLYCQEEVEAQFAEWQEAHVGENTPAQENGDDVSMPQSALLAHVERVRTTLMNLAEQRKRSVSDDLSEAYDRVAELLGDLLQDLTTETSPDTQKLETSLTGLERVLTDAIRRVVPAETLQSFEDEVKGQLKRFKNQMDADVYAQMFENLLLKRLREHFAVPRLSLFYL